MMTLANNTYFFKTIFFFFAIINKRSQNPHNKALQNVNINFEFKYVYNHT